MTEVQEFEELTDQELFDKMLGHHIKSVSEGRTERSRWHHQKLYEHTKRLLWERLDNEKR